MRRRSILLALPLLAMPCLARGALREMLEVVDLPQLRAIAIWRDGEEVAARGFGGFTPDRPTNIKSASKSIVSALAGIAIARGLFSGTDQRVAELLRADLPADPDPRLARLTLGHLLSMQAGLERQSGPNYGAWVSSRNWVRAALAAPFVADPGQGMLYSTASTHLVSAMLARASGRSTLALARDWLDIPGFSIAAWDRDPQGIHLGGNQMAMSTRSLLCFGAAYAAGGQGVIPPGWIAESWQPRTRSIFNDEAYGYGWFISRIAGRPVRYGWGYDGQMIYVFPAGSMGRSPVAIAMTSDPDRPSARSGYRRDLHALAGRLVQAL